MKKTNVANLFLILMATAVLGLFYLYVKVNSPYQSDVASDGTGRAPLEQPQPLDKPILSSADPSLGPPDVPYTIVNFSDFRCPYCASVAKELRTLQQKFPGKVRLIWKDFAFLPPAATSQRLHEAARCAGQQNKFWEYHDWLFENLGAASLGDDQLLAQAQALKLDNNKFSSCLASGQMKTLVQNNFEEGRRLGVDGTPYLFLNGEKVEGVEEIAAVIETK